MTIVSTGEALVDETLDSYRDYVSRMLRQFTDNMSRVAEGDYFARCSAERDDEFSVLCVAGNVLFETVRSSIQRLKDKTRELDRALAELRNQIETIQRQRVAIEELSTPILDVWHGVLALPIIGAVDTQRNALMMKKLLAEVVRKEPRFVIVDVTAVDEMDAQTADNFVRLFGAVELLGTRCILTGVSPLVAQRLVHLGSDLGSMLTMRTLEHGLRECLWLMGRGR